MDAFAASSHGLYKHNEVGEGKSRSEISLLHTEQYQKNALNELRGHLSTLKLFQEIRYNHCSDIANDVEIMSSRLTLNLS